MGRQYRPYRSAFLRMGDGMGWGGRGEGWLFYVIFGAF